MEPTSELEAQVLSKIRGYYIPAGLVYLAEFYLMLIGIQHGPVKVHSLRVALFAEAVAEKLEKNRRDAFLGGLFHDMGKLFFPSYFFDGREISAEEYTSLKEHARIGFEIWKSFNPLIAICAGLHHSYHDSENGITTADFPPEWDHEIIQEGMEIAIIVSICDFIDAAIHRHTHVRDGSDRNGNNLRVMLHEKFPDSQAIVEAALTVLSRNQV